MRNVMRVVLAVTLTVSAQEMPFHPVEPVEIKPPEVRREDVRPGDVRPGEPSSPYKLDVLERSNVPKEVRYALHGEGFMSGFDGAPWRRIRPTLSLISGIDASALDLRRADVRLVNEAYRMREVFRPDLPGSFQWSVEYAATSLPDDERAIFDALRANHVDDLSALDFLAMYRNPLMHQQTISHKMWSYALDLARGRVTVEEGELDVAVHAARAWTQLAEWGHVIDLRSSLYVKPAPYSARPKDIISAHLNPMYVHPERSDALRGKLAGLVAQARINSDRYQPPELAAEFARDRVAIPAGNPLRAKLETDVVDRLASYVERVRSRPSWQRGGEMNAIRGFSEQNTVIDLYLPHDEILRYDRQSRVFGVLSGAAAKEAYARACENAIVSNSRRDFRLAGVFREGRGYRVQTARETISLTSKDVATLKSGKPLGASHPLSEALASDEPFVLYSDPQAAVSANRNRQIEELGFLLRRAYPDAVIYKDELTAATRAKAAALTAQKIAVKNIVVVAPERGFKVDDRNAIRNSAADLKQSGIDIVDFKPGDTWTRPSGQAVIVISGHSAAELARYVRALGAADVFRGNYVLFNSCQTELTSALINEINERYGAVATFAYEGKIAPVRVQNLLRSLKHETESKTEFDLRQWWEKLAAEQQLQGMWIICRIFAETDRHA